MSLSRTDVDALLTAATKAAREAGEFIARSRPTTVEYKPGARTPASQVVTDIDERSQELIVRALAGAVRDFDLAVLTEEQQDDGARLHKEHFWCIDPLDGTLPFIEGTPGYAVSIALVSLDGTPQIGVVYDPVDGTLYHAARGRGVFRDGLPWTRPVGRTTLGVFADRSFATMEQYDRVVAELERIAEGMGLATVDIHATGAAVSNACRVLGGSPACYFKFPKPEGGGSLWDFAATACMFHEAGAVATDIHGGRLDLNRADSTFLGHRGVLFASDEGLASRVRALHNTLCS